MRLSMVSPSVVPGPPPPHHPDSPTCWAPQEPGHPNPVTTAPGRGPTSVYPGRPPGLWAPRPRGWAGLSWAGPLFFPSLPFPVQPWALQCSTALSSQVAACPGLPQGRLSPPPSPGPGPTPSQTRSPLPKLSLARVSCPPFAQLLLGPRRGLTPSLRTGTPSPAAFCPR